ncbi:unnamed protein product [Didymodactylos carnosus]|uniref:EF-hand domain-containing protein n=1 Tax=Didymodactylos carnosus TaxID=1234261 RepID=A0A813PFG5_9BILA|nr:unnamed protein product [Didymodactylos carnosus]CAF0752074.1 unnamed protein product [Didymodactylos carnosus]CAF3495118.1 unnamed protein product [Didymodactylos carnosus]CAF3531838.1 unnamed protein product [Didymodactylos carnosus]
MSQRSQIVPALASAVHSSTAFLEEIPIIHDNISPKLNNSYLYNEHTRLRSTSSASSNHPLESNHNNQPSYLHIPSTVSSTLSTATTNIFLSTPLDARRAFTYFDKNHDGKLTVKEFRDVMRTLGHKNFDKRFIQRMFAEADRNKNGVLELEEFVEFLESKFSMSTNSLDENSKINDHNIDQSRAHFDIESLFNCYDLDKNGVITAKELRKVMEKILGEKLTKEDIAEMMKAADLNNDGLIDKNELEQLCSAF